MSDGEFRYRSSIFPGFEFGHINGCKYVRRINDKVMVGYQVLMQAGAYRMRRRHKFSEIFDRLAVEQTIRKLEGL